MRVSVRSLCRSIAVRGDRATATATDMRFAVRPLWWAWSLLAEQRQRGHLIGQDEDVFTAMLPVRSLEG